MTVGLPPTMPFDSDAGTTKPTKSKRSRAADGSPVSTSTGERRRWRDRPRWLRWTVAVISALAAVGLVATPWWGPRVLARLDFFHVRTVEFDGLRFAKPAELVTRLAVDTTQSVWQSLDTLTARVAAHPMVLRVAIERDLPGVLRVHVTERVPVALVPGRSGLRPADATGQVLPIDPMTTPLDVPIASTADSTLLTVLDALRTGAPDLFARVTEARRVGAEELRFVLGGSAVGAAGPAMSNALVVRTSPDVTVARFRDILPVEADLARNHLRAVELDLRFRDQVIARKP